MLSYTFINSHSHVSNPGPNGLPVIKLDRNHIYMALFKYFLMVPYLSHMVLKIDSQNENFKNLYVQNHIV